MFGRENAKYCLMGTRLHMAFQRNSWIFLGHCNFHIQFHNGLSRGTCFCWYKIFDAELIEQIPLLHDQTKEFGSLENRATKIPLISCSICVGRET